MLGHLEAVHEADGLYACRSDYQAHEGRWETTNQHFYVDLPAEKRLEQPKYYNSPADTTHHIHAALSNEGVTNAQSASGQAGPCGRAGARGELCQACLLSHKRVTKLRTLQPDSDVDLCHHPKQSDEAGNVHTDTQRCTCTATCGIVQWRVAFPFADTMHRVLLGT